MQISYVSFPSVRYLQKASYKLNSRKVLSVKNIHICLHFSEEKETIEPIKLKVGMKVTTE